MYPSPPDQILILLWEGSEFLLHASVPVSSIITVREQI